MVLSAFGLLFFACEIGQRFTSEVEDISDMIDRFEWYSFPAEVQRMLPIIINVAQKPVEIECFGKIVCLRETFKSVSIVNIELIIQHL